MPTQEDTMKKCSLDHFTDSLKPWLDQQYIHRVVINTRGQVTFTFRDGISDTYEITDCDRHQVEKVCRDLAESGIAVEGLC